MSPQPSTVFTNDSLDLILTAVPCEIGGIIAPIEEDS